MKNYLKTFRHRLQMIFSLLTKHSCVLITLKKNELVDLIKGNDYEVEISFVQLRKYNAQCIIKTCCDNFCTDEDMILDKALFEAGVERRIN